MQVLILDALTYAGNLKTIEAEIALTNVKFFKGDINDTALVDNIFEVYDPDYVVKFAAESHVDRSFTNQRLFLKTNILGTQNMLECARRAWLVSKDSATGRCTYKPGKKYLQISTDEVYGSLAKDFDTAQPLHLADDVMRVVVGRDHITTFGKEFFTEERQLSPRSPYSASKTSADLIVQAYHHTYNLPVNITRCSNNYGPYHFPEKLIPLIINNILHGKKLPVYGKGENVRDWLYVTDHAKAIDMVLRQGEIGEVYNVGGFNEESNINIVRLVISIISRIMCDEPDYQQLLHCDISAVSDGLIEYVADRPGHDMRYAIDPTKIATRLGWYPETPFAEGIEKTVRWYLDNQEWVRDVLTGDYQRYYEAMYGNRK